MKRGDLCKLEGLRNWERERERERGGKKFKGILSKRGLSFQVSERWTKDFRQFKVKFFGLLKEVIEKVRYLGYFSIVMMD